MGTVVKANIGELEDIGELEEEVRAGSLRRMSQKLTGVVQGLLGRDKVLGEVSEWVLK